MSMTHYSKMFFCCLIKFTKNEKEKSDDNVIELLMVYFLVSLIKFNDGFFCSNVNWWHYNKINLYYKLVYSYKNIYLVFV